MRRTQNTIRRGCSSACGTSRVTIYTYLIFVVEVWARTTRYFIAYSSWLCIVFITRKTICVRCTIASFTCQITSRAHIKKRIVVLTSWCAFSNACLGQGRLYVQHARIFTSYTGCEISTQAVTIPIITISALRCIIWIIYFNSTRNTSKYAGVIPINCFRVTRITLLVEKWLGTVLTIRITI